MFPARYQYHKVDSFKAACEALDALGGEAKLLAGGQTLIPMMKLRLLAPKHLVDMGRIRDGNRIEISEDILRIGALSSHASIAGAEVIKPFSLLRDCAFGIADVQVRNMGTIGGSLAEADPCSCWPTALMALDARVVCVSSGAERTQTVAQLLKDAYTPNLEAGELVTEIQIDRSNLEGMSTFVAFKRAAPAYPTASCALTIRFDGEQVQSVGMALGCVGLTPIRVPYLDEILVGNVLDQSLIDDVAALASEIAEPVSDNKGSEAYKRSLIRGLVARAFDIVMHRKNGKLHTETHSYYG
ncbi:xanthine dehydrogenase family protein subunit M [Pusillimonas sp. NJUB218]|uniref:FAD binding domain-containing protein n=1 Tax=Pusillimonas sp. NJUB218 TaxID=2023230 RepID=UPI000F4CA80C|nr:xanthine dehydrogenase family protein subunit M [Pusillimonas sp. NJUB218]ROT43911.1 carbon monoxide dehydrogenase [Pusillimonas sp. NJUB218]